MVKPQIAGLLAVALIAGLGILGGCGGSSSPDPTVDPREAEEVLIWNQLALEAIAATGQMPPQASRALAMMHAAMYDGVNAVEKRGTVYRADVPAAPGASAEAAAIQAAYRVLAQLYPTQVAFCNAQRALSLGKIPAGTSRTDGIAVGDAVADNILAWRTNDGSAMMGGMPYTGGTDPGEWRPTPPGNMPGMFVWWRNVTPFALASADQFRPGPPPALDSVRYATDLNETQSIGAKTGANRTADQAAMAVFWVGMAGTVTEVGRMNQAAQQATAQRPRALWDTARLFAMMNIAMADAAIAGIDCKYAYSFWRPITAIREAASDGNAATVPDPTWESYLDTPAHPEYISTHSALTMAAATVLAQFYATDSANLALPAFTDPNVTRQYTSFSQVSQEAGLSRLYGGIHFRFSFETGTQLGQNIGQYAWNQLMQPL